MGIMIVRYGVMARTNIFLSLMVMAVLFGSQSALAATDPQVLVKRTTEQVLAEVTSKKQDLKANPGKIYPLIDTILLPRFDFGQIARLVLGKHWKSASEADKSAFTHEFRELLVRTYATALLSYSGEEIDYPPVKYSPDAKKVKIKTEVKNKGAGAVPIDYSLYLGKGDWMVYDITIDGVSLVSTYRTNFNSQIRRGDLAGLISDLKKKNAQNK
jgi:phospholipid transport system substrate-binding protein